MEVDISNLIHVHYSTNNVNPSHWTTVRINLGPFRLGVDGLSPSPNLFKFKKKVFAMKNGYRHRRRIYKEAKANCRPCFLGENGHQHASIKDCVADELI